MHISTIQRTNIVSQLRHIVPLVLTLCLFTSCNFGIKPVDPQRAVGKDSLPGSTPEQAAQGEVAGDSLPGSNLEQVAQGAVVGNSSPGSTPEQAAQGEVVGNSSPGSTPEQAAQGEAEGGSPSGSTPEQAAQGEVAGDSPPGSNLGQVTQREAEGGSPSGSNLTQAASQGAAVPNSLPQPASLTREETTQQQAAQARNLERVRQFCRDHAKEIFLSSYNSLEWLQEQIAADKSPEEVFPLIKERLDDPKKKFGPSEQITLLTDCVRYGKVNAEAMAGKDVVVVLGNTGAGKSTFINYLAGCQLQEKSVVGEWELVLEVRGTSSGGGRDEVAPIGHGASQTFMPQIVAVDDQVYCDCPGFRDNRGVEINIANAVNIKQALSQAQSLRMVVLVDYNSLLADRGNDFKNLLRTLQDLFGSEEEIVKHEGSILLGISKWPDGKTREMLQKGIARYIPPSLSFLKNHLFIFNPLLPEAGWDREGCLEELNKLTRIQNPSSILSVPLDDTELYALRTLVGDMSKDIVSLLKKDPNSAFNKYCHLAQISVIDHQEIWSLLSSTWGDILKWVKQQEEEFRLKYTAHCFTEAEKLLSFLRGVANAFSLDTSEIDPSSLDEELEEAHKSSVEKQEERAALQAELAWLQEKSPVLQADLASLKEKRAALQAELASYKVVSQKVCKASPSSGSYYSLFFCIYFTFYHCHLKYFFSWPN